MRHRLHQDQADGAAHADDEHLSYIERNTKHQPNRLDAFALGPTGIYSSEDASFDLAGNWCQSSR